MAKIHFQTLGCRLNQAEAERMAQTFILAGHQVVDHPSDAEVRVINTCTVTSSAGTKSRRTARRNNQAEKIVVTGCHSQVKPGDFPDADLIVDNADKDNLAALSMEKFGLEGFALGMDYRASGRLAIYPLVLNKTRAFVKIQDGCNLQCTYCMTRIARGASHSRPADEVVEEVKTLHRQGCREIVLTGVHAGSYFIAPDLDLGRLMERIILETGIPRIRLSSLEPWNMQPHWTDLWERYPERLCRHLHMSLQSGSNTVLRRMQRAYQAEDYAAKVQELRKRIPLLAITTDIIVGFPGETREEHEESMRFVRDMDFAGAHIFTFSPRPGTVATGMPGQRSSETKKSRLHAMKKITDASSQTFRTSMVTHDLPVLWEGMKEEDPNLISGLTDNYLRVTTRGNPGLSNTITRTIINLVSGDELEGDPVPAQAQVGRPVPGRRAQGTACPTTTV